MCVVRCDTDYNAEDAGVTYLVWESGRYVPAPPLLYVPGLRPLFQKQSKRVRCHAEPSDLQRTSALPNVCYASRQVSGGAIFAGRNPRLAAKAFSHGKPCDQPAPITATTSYDRSSQGNGAYSFTQAHSNGMAEDEGNNSAQHSL